MGGALAGGALGTVGGRLGYGSPVSGAGKGVEPGIWPAGLAGRGRIGISPPISILLFSAGRPSSEGSLSVGGAPARAAQPSRQAISKAIPEMATIRFIPVPPPWDKHGSPNGR